MARCFWLPISIVLIASLVLCNGFKWTPQSKAELQKAITECVKLASADCSKGPHGSIGSWDVTAVADMRQLFMFNRHTVPSANEFADDISKWDVSKVTNMGFMFGSATWFNGDLSKWDVSSVTSMKYMFNAATSFNGDLSKWPVSKVVDMIRMFASATAFNGDISTWNVAKVINMQGMFASASSFNGDISKWDVSTVLDMKQMFYSATSFNIDLSKWDVSGVTSMRQMFSGASSFAQMLCGSWVISKATKDGMFDGSAGGRICEKNTPATSNGWAPYSTKELHAAVKDCQ